MIQERPWKEVWTMGLRIDRERCLETLKRLYREAEKRESPVRLPQGVENLIENLIRSTVGAPLRVLLALLIAKLLNPRVNILYPVSGSDGIEGTFSGRTVDENCIQILIDDYRLPLNQTTGFLTPAFRTLKLPISENLGNEIGKNKTVYNAFSSIIHKVQRGELNPEEVLIEILRKLILLREERMSKLEYQLRELSREDLDLSAEDIVFIIHQLLSLPKSSRIPVVVVAALHKTLEECLNEKVKPLESHTAADSKTGALGDVELTAESGDIVRVYEVKDRQVTESDIHVAVEKIARLDSKRSKLRQYLFVTTKPVDRSVLLKTREVCGYMGIEMTVLDCLGFTRHFLHLFFPFRHKFVDNLTKLIMAEPDSSINYAIKERYISLLGVFGQKEM